MQVRKAVIGLLVVLQVNLKLHTDCSMQKGSMKVKRRMIKKRQIWGWLLQNRYAKSKVPDNTEKASVTFYIVTDLMYFYFCREFTSLSLPRQEEESVQSWVLHWTLAPPPGVQRAFSPPLSSRWSSWNSSIRMLCWLWSVVTSTGSLERMQRWELKSRCVSDAFRGSLNLNCIKYKRHILCFRWFSSFNTVALCTWFVFHWSLKDILFVNRLLQRSWTSSVIWIITSWHAASPHTACLFMSDGWCLTDTRFLLYLWLYMITVY